jgi:hypothetical protein
MIQIIITIQERDGVAGIQFTPNTPKPTNLEIAVLKEECRAGFDRHSPAIQAVAERALTQLIREQTSPT